MDSSKDFRRFIQNIPQIVPESWCLECRICCRFPDTQGVQTPFWSKMETQWAREGVPEASSWFVPEKGSPSLSPHLVACSSAGYRCPAFEPETNRCRIHAVKPLDCRLYPFVLTRNPGGTQVLLAMDSKCPFIERHREDPELTAYVARLSDYLETQTGTEYLLKNPKVVGPAWPEYLWAAALPGATAWIQETAREKPSHPALHPLRDADWPELERMLRAGSHRASHYTLPALLGWRDLIRCWVFAFSQGGIALIAEQAGGFCLPVPPIGCPLDEDGVGQAWGLLLEINRGNSVSRIEGIEAADVSLFEKMGFSVRCSEEEYLYAAADLARLRGDRYRSQRWAINRCSKAIPFRIRPFEPPDIVPCLQLYTRWAIRRQRAAEGDLEKRLLRDSLFFHRRLMMDWEKMGFLGRVLESEGRILAYTFGASISSDVFCVFAEISEREVPGLAQTLFREFCREAQQSGHRWINAMGDSGLPAMRRAKLAYRPAVLLPVFTATME